MINDNNVKYSLWKKKKTKKKALGNDNNTKHKKRGKKDQWLKKNLTKGFEFNGEVS